MSLGQTQTKEEVWNRNYEDTLEYVKAHKTMSGISRRLSNWFRRQNKRKDISFQEMKLLKDLAALTDGLSVSWNDMFERYRQYREETGRTCVPKKDKKLSQWVAQQRKAYKEGRLGDDRIQLLRTVGFVFVKNKHRSISERYTTKQKENWDAMYDELHEFVNKNHHANVKFDSPEHPQLSHWVAWQRQMYKHGDMDPSRIQRLESIGFCWKVP